MAQYIYKDALVAEIESKIEKYTKRGEESDAKRDGYGMFWVGVLSCLNEVRTLCDTLEVKEVDISSVSENLVEAYEYLDFTSTGNLAHNKPMVSARLKKAIRGLFDARLFKLTHDEKYRMENLGLKAQKGE